MENNRFYCANNQTVDICALSRFVSHLTEGWANNAFKISKI